MAKTPASSTAADIVVTKLSTPRIFLVRMLVFLVLCSLLVVVLYKQIWVAFLANPGLNALIAGVLAIGIILAFRQVIRLYPEISWVNSFRISDPGLAVDRRPRLLAPMAAMLSHRTGGRMSISQQTMRHMLDSIATRLDEARDLSRYMTGLLVFLGLLGTFWGLIETVGSVGKVIEGLKVGGDAGSVFDTLKEGLAAPLGGMGISFSSSLFGLAGSLILGFLDLQLGQAMGRFFNELEDWLSAFARFNDNGPAAGDGGGTPLASGMSEEAARALIHLGNSIAAGEDNRQRVLDQLGNINMTLAALNEAMTDDRRLREQLAQLNAGIAQLSVDLQDDRGRANSAVVSELRALANAVNKTAGSRVTRQTKGG
ncbi:MAG TPA: flagellar motor protein MotA [Afipia sp.]|nr:flagellar motor protein MotA [Afipia sp.]